MWIPKYSGELVAIDLIQGQTLERTWRFYKKITDSETGIITKEYFKFITDDWAGEAGACDRTGKIWAVKFDVTLGDDGSFTVKYSDINSAKLVAGSHVWTARLTEPGSLDKEIPINAEFRVRIGAVK